jgi:NAD(P)-dependent dehydrogenase (short-subunit alcohol dehydrogenase family)
MAGRDSLLKLNDKTVAVVGEFSSMTQMILTLLSEQGADVALVGKESPEARRVCEHLNDQREIYAHYGRAGVIATDLAQAKDAADIVGRVVHSFGRLDCLVDTLPCTRGDFVLSAALVQESLKFLTSRPRSRIIWLSHHRQLQDIPFAAELESLRTQMAEAFGPKNLTANELVLGVSEEYLLRRNPKSPSMKIALEDLKKQIPRARLLEPSEIAAWVMFLASPLSQAVNGQALGVDHGL